jgi:hypothetical protein
MCVLKQAINSWLAMALTFACLSVPCRAQQLEPRRWNHLPIGANFAATGYAYTQGDIFFDPVLLLDDVELDLHSIPFKYIHVFELLGKTARVDWLQAYEFARWNGLLDGVPASTSRAGFSDMSLRFAVNLIGAPPLSGEAFKEYKATTDRQTIVGTGVVVHLPTGLYFDDKLLNLGTNRFTIRPQLGVVHSWGKWSAEATGSCWFFTDNNDFFNGSRLEQDPLYTIQAHADYTFRPGLWVSAGLGYGVGAESTLNGVRKNDEKGSLGWVTSLGIPINRQCNVKIAYIGSRRQTRVGSDTDSIVLALSAFW